MGNPMPRELQEHPRCRAHCRLSKKPCGQPAMRGRRVCRMHGGKAGRKPTHGRYTRAAVEARQELRVMLRLLREMIDAAE